jgi:copper homeostasis protein
MLFEACVDAVESATAAGSGGADRVELCAALIEGGLTPSAGTIALARARLAIPIHVMIRPRGGDFLYSPDELEVMRRDIQVSKDLGADGVVFGVLTGEGDIDRDRSGELVALARPMAVTFHRAFDMTRDPRAALEALIALGVERVLTSGQEATAADGADLIADLVRQAAGRIIVMPGGGIDERTIEDVVRRTGAAEVHAAALAGIESAMRFRNPRCYMGSEAGPGEFTRTITDADLVGRLVARARSGADRARPFEG